MENILIFRIKICDKYLQKNNIDFKSQFDYTIQHIITAVNVNEKNNSVSHTTSCNFDGFSISFFFYECICENKCYCKLMKNVFHLKCILDWLVNCSIQYCLSMMRNYIQNNHLLDVTKYVHMKSVFHFSIQYIL